MLDDMSSVMSNRPMKSLAEYKRDERQRKRDAGWVLKHMWVKPSKWKAIQSAAVKIQGEPK